MGNATALASHIDERNGVVASMSGASDFFMGAITFSQADVAIYLGLSCPQRPGDFYDPKKMRIVAVEHRTDRSEDRQGFGQFPG